MNKSRVKILISLLYHSVALLKRSSSLTEETENEFGSTRSGRIVKHESKGDCHIFTIVHDRGGTSDLFTPDHLSFRVFAVGGDLTMKIRIPLRQSHLIIGAIFWPYKLRCPDIYKNLIDCWIDGSHGVILEGQQQLLADPDVFGDPTFWLHSAIISFLKHLVTSTGTADIDQSTLLQIFCRAEAFSAVDSWIALGAIGHVVATFDTSHPVSLASLGLQRLLQIPHGVLDSDLARSEALGSLHDIIHVHAGLKFLLEKKLGTPFPLFSGVMPLMRRINRMKPTYWDSIRYTTSVDLEYQRLCAWRNNMTAALQKTGEVPADTIINSIAAVDGAVPDYLVLPESKPVSDLLTSLGGAVTYLGVIIRGLAERFQTAREEKATWQIALAVRRGAITTEKAIGRYSYTLRCIQLSYPELIDQLIS